ncbi:MAG: isochorismatase family protein [Acidimicrobiales bacterium]
MVGHNLVGSIQTELMPELGPAPGEVVIRTERRLSNFGDTDLEQVLRSLGTDTVLLVGINTSTCVMCAAFEAFNRDLRVVVVSDGVASMYGDDLHRFGLENVARCLGWVVPAQEAMDRLAAGAGPTAGAGVTDGAGVTGPAAVRTAWATVSTEPGRSVLAVAGLA